jgi:large repetitive protein
VDEFRVSVSDGALQSPEAVFTITVTAVNDAPVAVAQQFTISEDGSLTAPLNVTDVDDTVLSFMVVNPVSHGMLSLTGGSFSYSPPVNWHGQVSFQYSVTDGQAMANAMVEITVADVNDAPETGFDLFSVNEDQSLAVGVSRRVLRNDSDYQEGGMGENNTPLTAQVEDAPAHASSFSLAADGTFTYTPTLNFHGTDSFTYRAWDSRGGLSEPETVLITVRSVNDAPVAQAVAKQTLEDVPVTFSLASSDADVNWTIDPLQPYNPGPAPRDSNPIYTISQAPQHGTLTGTAPRLTYTPAANYAGTDTFTYTVSDGLATSAPATVTITIQADGDADALPDAWEAQYLIGGQDGGDDGDGDGQDNAFEYLAGTNPADASSRLVVDSAGLGPQQGVFRLSPVRPGVVYTLEASEDLAGWAPNASATYETTGLGALRASQPAAGVTRQFYRVTLAPAVEE